ncbi:MAG: hypothetical protein NVS1B14_04540 [Vulcanimicrobiaceae bacterium]
MLRTFFLASLIALLTTALLVVCAASARTVRDARLRAYIPLGYQLALANLQQSIAADYVAGRPQHGLPFTRPRAVLNACVAADDPCRVRATAWAEFSTQTPPGTAACSAAPSCAQNLQVQGAVAEGRASVHVIVEVMRGDGMLVLSRDKYVTLRTFAVSPYAAVIGERDGATAESAADGEGDSAGLSTTRIAVKYRAPGRADVPQNVWSTRGWTGGNAQRDRWSP